MKTHIKTSSYPQWIGKTLTGVTLLGFVFAVGVLVYHFKDMI